jgi:hypothetical protein
MCSTNPHPTADADHHHYKQHLQQQQQQPSQQQQAIQGFSWPCRS